MSRKSETEDVPLSRGFSRPQWSVIYLLSCAGALVAALTISIQPLLLDKVFGIAFEKEGAINADVQVVAEIASILGVGWFGLMSDRIGRVPVIKGGFLAICLGALLSLVSLEAGLTVGAGALGLFYVTRALISSGADAVQLEVSTLVGDITEFHNRPKLLTKVVFMMFFGGTILSAIIMQVTEQPGGIGVIIALPFFIGISGFFLARRHLSDVAPKTDDIANPLRQVWDFVSNDPRMQLAFAAEFYTRGDAIILSLFYSIWCISLSDIAGYSRTYAASHAALMIGLLGAGVLISIPVWKIVIERSSRISAIGASLSMAGIGYLSLGLFVNPYNWLVALPLLLIGVGHAGCTVTLKVLTVDISPKPILGAVLGMAYLTGGAGIIMLTQSGGYYFDAVGPRAPFMLMGTAKLLVTLYAGWLILAYRFDAYTHQMLGTPRRNSQRFRQIPTPQPATYWGCMRQPDRQGLIFNGIDENSAHHMKSSRKIDWKPLVFMSAALPFIWLIGRSMIGGYIVGGSLTETPVGFINRYLGDWAFTFMIISLAMRPLQQMTGLSSLAKYRRMIGLYAFFYAVMHVIAFIALEWAFNVGDMIADVYKRPFILL